MVAGRACGRDHLLQVVREAVAESGIGAGRACGRDRLLQAFLAALPASGTLAIAKRRCRSAGTPGDAGGSGWGIGRRRCWGRRGKRGGGGGARPAAAASPRTYTRPPAPPPPPLAYLLRSPRRRIRSILRARYAAREDVGKSVRVGRHYRRRHWHISAFGRGSRSHAVARRPPPGRRIARMPPAQPL